MPAGPARHGPGWRRAQGHSQGSQANSRGPAESPASTRSALRESDSHSPGPTRVPPSQRSPPPLPPLVSALCSSTGRLSLGRAVTSPGHRLRRLLPEVSLRTEGHAHRVHAHSRTARLVPPAHTLGVPLRALLDSHGRSPRTPSIVPGAPRSHVCGEIASLILLNRSYRTVAPPTQKLLPQPTAAPRHPPATPRCAANTLCLLHTSNGSFQNNPTTQHSGSCDPLSLGKEKGPSLLLTGLIWRRELDVSPNPHQRLLPLFTLS